MLPDEPADMVAQMRCRRRVLLPRGQIYFRFVCARCLPRSCLINASHELSSVRAVPILLICCAAKARAVRMREMFCDKESAMRRAQKSAFVALYFFVSARVYATPSSIAFAERDGRQRRGRRRLQMPSATQDAAFMDVEQAALKECAQSREASCFNTSGDEIEFHPPYVTGICRYA